MRLLYVGIEADLYEGGRDAEAIENYMRERAAEKVYTVLKRS